MLVALYPDHVVAGEEGADIVPLVHQQIVAGDAFHDHLAGFPVFGADQAIVAGDHDVVYLIAMGIDRLFDPLESDRQVVVLEQNNHHVVADHVIIQVLRASHMDGVIGNVVLHVFNPLHRVGIAVFVVAHQWQKFNAGIAVAFGNGGPLLEFAGGAVVSQVAHGDDDVGAQCLFFIQHRFHGVHGHVVAAALGVGQQANTHGGGGGGCAAFIGRACVVG